MAGENQNPTSAASEQRFISERERRLAGDFNDLLKESESLIKRMVGHYKNMEAKLEALNKGSINIKEINKEIVKAKEKNVLLDKEIERQAKNQTDSVKDYVYELNRASQLSGDAKDQQLEFVESMFKRLSLEEQSVANLIVAKEQTDESLKLAQKKLDIEKQTNANVGITGRLLGNITKSLGGSNEVYEELLEKTRLQIEATGKGLTFSEKLGFVYKSVKNSVSSTFEEFKSFQGAILLAGIGIKKLADFGGNLAKNVANSVGSFMTMSGDQVIGKMTSSIASMAKNIPLIGGFLGGFVEAFGKLLELSLKEDDKIAKIGRNLGVSKEQAAQINQSFISIANNSGKAAITSDRLMASQMALNAELGTTNVLSAQILKTDVELATLAGIDAKTRAGIAQSSIITGKSSEAITKSVLAQVGGLKAATGISFDYKKVLSEASGFSGVLGLQFAKYPEKLSQSLVSVKSMGMELQKLDSMADQFLNFEQSISKEFEAQLLTGKNINLAKAREAFLNNDLATAAKEITRQVGNSSQFLKMNRIQQQSFAESMGMSREDLADMLKKQEAYAKLGATDLKSAQAKVEALKAQGLSQKEISEKIGQDAYNDITRASAQEKIAGFLEKIQNAVGNFLSKSPIMALIDKAMKFLEQPDSINKIVEKLKGFFAFVFDVMGTIAGGIMKGLNLLPGVNIDDSLIRQVQTGGAMIRSMNLGDFSVGENAAKSNTSAGGSTSSNTSMVSSGAPVIYMRNEGDFQFKVVEVKSGQAVIGDYTKISGPTGGL